MEKLKITPLAKRLLSSIVLIPLVIFCVLYGYPLIYLLALLCMSLLSWEWAHMLPLKDKSLYAISYLNVAVSYILFDNIWLKLLITLVVAFIVFNKSRDEKFRFIALLGVPYIALGLSSIVYIYNDFNQIMVLWFMLLVWGVDIGGYLFGSTIKGPKLAPSISPNKTWAGLIGGMLLSVAVSYSFCLLFNLNSLMHIFGIAAAVLAVIAQIGDLIESFIKRRLGLKDSSDLIPGHGGIFDRIDGLIFAAPFAYVFFRNITKFLD